MITVNITNGIEDYDIVVELVNTDQGVFEERTFAALTKRFGDGINNKKSALKIRDFVVDIVKEFLAGEKLYQKPKPGFYFQLEYFNNGKYWAFRDLDNKNLIRIVNDHEWLEVSGAPETCECELCKIRALR